jgi:hypothetical protein
MPFMARVERFCVYNSHGQPLRVLACRHVARTLAWDLYLIFITLISQDVVWLIRSRLITLMVLVA